MFQRTVIWGQSLRLAIVDRGGLVAPVQRIQDAVGAHIGSRATFSKLMNVESPEQLDETDRFRAWLLLIALGDDPDEWGLSAKNVRIPAALDVPRLKSLLCPRPDSNGHATDYTGSPALRLVA